VPELSDGLFERHCIQELVFDDQDLLAHARLSLTVDEKRQKCVFVPVELGATSNVLDFVSCCGIELLEMDEIALLRTH
jgi:hypothetical protein